MGGNGLPEFAQEPVRRIETVGAGCDSLSPPTSSKTYAGPQSNCLWAALFSLGQPARAIGLLRSSCRQSPLSPGWYGSGAVECWRDDRDESKRGHWGFSQPKPTVGKKAAQTQLP